MLTVGCKPNTEAEIRKSKELKPQASAPVKMTPSENKKKSVKVQKEKPKISTMEEGIRSRILEKRRHMYDTDFPKINWTPDRGVELLSPEETEQIWSKFDENASDIKIIKDHCSLPSLSIERENPKVQSFFAFVTNSHYIFVYDIDENFRGPYDLIWSICEKQSKKQASYISKYPGEFDEFSPLATTLGNGCGMWITKVSFRKLTKEGSLFLEVQRRRCQDNENHQEYIFHLDKEDIREVQGSRMEIDEMKSQGQSWTWWYTGEKYKPRDYKWKGDTVIWKRDLKRVIGMKHSREYYPSVVVRRNCRYNQSQREVVCKETVVEAKKFTRDDYWNFTFNNMRFCEESKTATKDCIQKEIQKLRVLRKAGFKINNEVVEHYFSKNHGPLEFFGIEL